LAHLVLPPTAQAETQGKTKRAKSPTRQYFNRILAEKLYKDKMSLFQKTIIKKYTQDLNSQKVQEAYTLYQAYFLNQTIQENIREAKEEQFQEGFLRELFGNILGYTLNPNPNFNLTTELKNISNSKKVDGAILIDNKAVAVIELKGTDTTDLAKIEVQAFGYKNNQPHCTYVITSNFEKLRFYIDNTIEFIEFNLFSLNREDFNLLWLCLSLKSIEHNIPKRIKDESVSKEDLITKQLYKDYSNFKQAIFNSLVERNKQFDKLLLFKKTQKLLDRFLFIFFAEDRLLLPANLIVSINSEWKKLQDMRVEQHLYERYKLYFNDLNTGNAKQDIYSYNGGLFAPDEILDKVAIEDELLYHHTKKLSNYDFQSEVDVNILGHIFENSLNEIENITSEIEGQELDKSKTRRKKDGVFYTPKYITKYIVQNTIGKLCLEKKEEIQLIEEQYINDKKKTTKTKKELLDKLNSYRNWLLQLTICDPACGSGAFLNQALEFLISEHRYIDELQAKLLGASMILSDIENSILENNLFGVDINDESVEIAKLSLWLRTAQRNRKLNSLNNNIKCGNSLIDDTNVAGAKAFNWQKEFPQVFAKGGFDVIIGNPPYGIFISKEEEQHYKINFPLTSYKTNLYVLFIERMQQIFNKGIIHFIIPKSLLFNTYYESIRKHLLETTEINEIITITEKVFEDAEVGGSLLLKYTIKQNPNKKNIIHLVNAEKIIQFINNSEIIENRTSQDYFLNIPNCEISITSKNSQSVINKLHNFNKIGDYYTLKNGLNPGNIKHILIAKEKLSEKHKPIIWGKDIARYNIVWSNEYINYDEKINEKITLADIKSKEGMNKQNKIDFALRSTDLFESKKIVVRKTGDSLICSIDEDRYYFDTLVHGIYKKTTEFSLEYLLAIINSKPATKFYRLLHDIKGKVFAKISLDNLSSFPIPQGTLIQKENLVEKVQFLLKKTKALYEIKSEFNFYFKSKYGIDNLSVKLQNWNTLEFKDFIKELLKLKIKLSAEDEFSFMILFEKQKKVANEIQSIIDDEDKEIDRIVYELYDISEDEIKIVEGK
jgi:type I restriction-modification system DNA methylase subunit